MTLYANRSIDSNKWNLLNIYYHYKFESNLLQATNLALHMLHTYG